MSPSLASVGWPVVDRVLGFSPHGVFIAIGFATGAWLFGRLAARRGISVDAVNSIVFWSLIGAIVGARVAYVIARTRTNVATSGIPMIMAHNRPQA